MYRKRTAFDVGVGRQHDLHAPPHTRILVDECDRRTKGCYIVGKFIARIDFGSIDLVK
jgi:hypothetical protein